MTKQRLLGGAALLLFLCASVGCTAVCKVAGYTRPALPIGTLAVLPVQGVPLMASRRA
ncbi:MAG: hypothetical protein AAF809_11740 [Bacteroidota bacterium]